MTTARDVHNTVQAALRDHFETSPYGCTTNHLKCRICQRLAAVEEEAWFAAHIEVLAERNPSMDLCGSESPFADIRKSARRREIIAAREAAGLSTVFVIEPVFIDPEPQAVASGTPT